MVDMDYYKRTYQFMETPLVGITPEGDQSLVLVARKGPFVAMVERVSGETIWNGRLLFGMPDKDGIAGSPALLGVAQPHHQLSVVLLRLVQCAHEVKRAALEACAKKKRKKYDYRTPKKRA